MKKNKLFIVATTFILAVAGCSQIEDKKNAESSEIKNVRLLHLGDMHAQLDTHWEFLPEDPEKLHKMGGFARVKTALDSFRKISSRSSLFSGWRRYLSGFGLGRLDER